VSAVKIPHRGPVYRIIIKGESMVKHIITVTLMFLVSVGLVVCAYGVDQTATTNVNATVGGVFSLSFYNDASVLYGPTVPFSNVLPTTTENYSDTHSTGKTDVGLICMDNSGTQWKLKIAVNTASPLAGKLLFNMGQPTDRNTSGLASGSRGYGDDWYAVPTTATAIYTAGAGDTICTPLGVLATLTFKVDGTGLTPGAKAATVTYTLTESA